MSFTNTNNRNLPFDEILFTTLIIDGNIKMIGVYTENDFVNVYEMENYIQDIFIEYCYDENCFDKGGRLMTEKKITLGNVLDRFKEYFNRFTLNVIIKTMAPSSLDFKRGVLSMMKKYLKDVDDYVEVFGGRNTLLGDYLLDLNKLISKSEKKPCVVCSNISYPKIKQLKPLRFSGCNTNKVYYCSTKCQKSHWKEHSKVCECKKH